MKTAAEQNKEYINNHVENVKKGYEFIKNYVPEMLKDCDIKQLDKQIEKHDESKWSKEEYDAYAEHFFGKFKGKMESEDHDFELAWKHHYLNNKHHPEYWNGNDMPVECILEMICDWWSFSWKKNNLNEMFEYNEASKKRKILSTNTYNILIEKLDMLKRKLKILKLI